MSTLNPPAASGAATAPSRPVPTEQERAAATTMLRLIWGIHSSRAVYAAAKLGIADLLADGPARCEDLARATGTHAPSLYLPRRRRTLMSSGHSPVPSRDSSIIAASRTRSSRFRL